MFADHTFIYEHCVTSGRHFTDDMAKMVPVSCIDYTVQTCYLRFCDTWVCVIQERWTTVSVCWTSVKPACQTTVSVTCYPSHLNTASYCWRTSTRRSLVKMPLNWVSYHHVSLMSAPACTYCIGLCLYHVTCSTNIKQNVIIKKNWRHITSREVQSLVRLSVYLLAQTDSEEVMHGTKSHWRSVSWLITKLSAQLAWLWMSGKLLEFWDHKRMADVGRTCIYVYIVIIIIFIMLLMSWLCQQT